MRPHFLLRTKLNVNFSERRKGGWPLHRCHQKPKAVAKVAAARKLAVRLYWILRTQVAYPEIVRIESSSRVALVGAS